MSEHRETFEMWWADYYASSFGSVPGILQSALKEIDEKSWQAALAQAQVEAVPESWRNLIEDAAECISEAVTYEQDGFDSPPQPATQWDYNAEQLAYALRGLLADTTATEAAISDAEIDPCRPILRALIEFIDREGPASKEWQAISELCERGARALDGDHEAAIGMPAAYDRATVESWIVRAQLSLASDQPQVARIQLEAALQALYGTEATI